MKRTCKTCGRCLFFARGKCHIRTCTCTPVGEDAPGCPMWELSPVEFRHAMLISLEKACRKHPVFLDVWPEAESAETYLDTAEIHKLGIGKKDSNQLCSVLFSEVFEFLAEIARGDFDRALEEAGDIMAVLYRTLNGDGQKKDKKND